MGGLNHPIFQGEIEGYKSGLKSSQTIHDYIKNLDLSKNKTEYWTGFGFGYAKGKHVRELLEKDSTCELTFDEKTDYYLYLYCRQSNCKVNLTESYLKNLTEWNKAITPVDIIEETSDLLNRNKVQMAIQQLLDHYPNTFQLKSLIEMDKLLQQLDNFRRKKRDQQSEGHAIPEEIRRELHEWLCNCRSKISVNP